MFWTRAGRSVAVPAESLGVFRWIYGLYFLSLWSPRCAWIDRAPRAFFNPPPLSLSALFDGFPPPPVFHVLDALTFVALCLVTIGLHTRSATIALLVLKLVAANFRFSFGKVDHDILVNAILVCMLIGDWGRYYSLDARHRNDAPRDPRWALALLAVLLGFGMFSAGLPKALRWVDFDLHTSGVLSWFYPNLITLHRELLLGPYVHLMPSLVLELGDYAAPILELSPIIALLWSRRVFMAWLLVVTGFHLSNALLLNIHFNDYVVLYCAFVNLAGLGSALRRHARAVGAAVLGLTVWHLYASLFHDGARVALVTDARLAENIALYSAVPICLLGMTLLAREMARAGRTAQMAASQRSVAA